MLATNSALTFYFAQCLEVLEDHEETFLKYYMSEQVPDNVSELVCQEAAKYCDGGEKIPGEHEEL